MTLVYHCLCSSGSSRGRASPAAYVKTGVSSAIVRRLLCSCCCCSIKLQTAARSCTRDLGGPLGRSQLLCQQLPDTTRVCVA
jgi:hypothetical protein